MRARRVHGGGAAGSGGRTPLCSAYLCRPLVTTSDRSLFIPDTLLGRVIGLSYEASYQSAMLSV